MLQHRTRAINNTHRTAWTRGSDPASPQLSLFSRWQHWAAHSDRKALQSRRVTPSCRQRMAADRRTTRLSVSRPLQSARGHTDATPAWTRQVSDKERRTRQNCRGKMRPWRVSPNDVAAQQGGIVQVPWSP